MSYIAEAVQRARQLGATAEGAAAWRELLQQTHVDEADYSDWCRELAALYARQGRALAAARVHEYLLNIDPALELYKQKGTGRDLGRVLRLGRRHREAGQRYREAGLFAHAARAAEDAGDTSDALALFEQLVRQKEATSDPYLAGLAAVNAGRLAGKVGLKDRQRAALALATRLLEEEGDRREQAGDRDGAFRCYLCLVQVGRLEESYEHFAEGYLNCIRILKAKGDRFFTIQYYYDFIAASDELGELHSVAELYREAGEYARRVGFIYADHFLVEAAKAWLRVAQSVQERGQPPELVENALLAASGCFNRVLDDKSVADCYARLATLDLAEKKKVRYAALAADLARVTKPAPAEPPPFPEYFRRRLPVQEVWLRDLLEHENGADIPDAIGRLVGDHKNVWEVQRRKALLIALSWDDHVTAGGDPQRVPAALVERLGDLQHAAAVRPLDAMFEQGDEPTRLLVIERGAQLKQKEVFPLIEKALRTPGRVHDAAVAAVRRMTFQPAVDHLVRIFNSFDAADVRDAALKSIAAVGTDEAGEFLLDVLRSNTGNLAPKAKGLLEQHAQERMLSALERNKRQEPDTQMRMFIGRLVDRIRMQRGVAERAG
jgi:tetratricopeptide (TPR) repeat protein